MANERSTILKIPKGQFWVALAAVGTLLIVAWGIYEWIFPTRKHFLDYFFPVSIEVIVNSGTGQPFPLELAIPTGSTGKEYLKISLVSFVLVNGSNRPHESPYVFKVDQLPVPTFGVEVLTYSTYRSTAQSCSGQQITDELFTGKNDFCIQFTIFPEGAIVQILLLFEQKLRPFVKMDRIFVGSKNNERVMQPIKIVDLLIEHRKLRQKFSFLFYFLIVLTCVILFMLLRKPIWRWWHGS